MTSPYAEAARKKLALARTCRAELDRHRRGLEEERAAVQRAFEGLLASGISAGDQLSAALAERFGLRLRRSTPRDLLARAPAGDELVDAFRAWAESAIVRDARRRRNLPSTPTTRSGRTGPS
jgi:hypothetical protein